MSDLLYEVRWQEETLPPQAVPTGRWLIVMDSNGVGEALADALDARGSSCVRAWPGPRLEPHAPGGCVLRPGSVQDLAAILAEPGPPWQGAVLLGALDATVGGAEEEIRRGCEGVLAALHAGARAARALRLWLVTRGAQKVCDESPGPPAPATLWGLGRVMACEHPELWGGLVDLDPEATPQRDTEVLCGALSRADGEERADRKQRIRVPRLIAETWSRPTPPSDLPSGTYLVAEGAEGAALLAIRWLVSGGVRRIILAGPDAARRAASPACRELAEPGVELRALELDLSDATCLKGALRETVPDEEPLVGIVYAGSAGKPRLLELWEPVSLGQAVAEQAATTRALHDLALASDTQVFVLFGSAAALLGPPAHAEQAASGAWLATLGQRRRAMGLPALVMAWGPGIDGNASSFSASGPLRALGIGDLSPEDASALLDFSLSQPLAQPVALRVDWDRFTAVLFGSAPPALLRGLPGGGDAEQNHADLALVARIEAAPPAQRPELLLPRLLELTQALLVADPEAVVDPDRGLFDLGLDSLGVLLLRTRLQRMLERSVPMTAVFDHPTLRALSGFLIREVLHLDDGTRADSLAGDPGQELEGLFASVEELSESEAEALLRESL